MSVGAYIHRLHLSIDHALAVSYRRNVYDGKNRYVARVTLVKGIPFYGFHVGYHYYLKIYMLNPMTMTRLADLLRQGAIMKKVFQPYEAHLQYLLQWMADYNLYGCGYIDCSKVYFRSPVPVFEEMDNLSHLWHDQSIPPENLLALDLLPRVSHCSIEVDICVQDILNRAEVKSRPLHHDFIERMNPLAPDEKLVNSMAGLWRDETRRRKAKMINPDPGSSPFPKEVLVSMSADPRYSQRGGWIHEEEYMQQAKNLIKEEKEKSDGMIISFDNFVKRGPSESHVKTVLDSVEDLYPQNLVRALGLRYEGSQIPADGAVKSEDFEIDEKRIFNFNDDDYDEFPYDSDEEVMRELKLTQVGQGDQVQEDSPPSDAVKAEHGINNEKYPGGRDLEAQVANPGARPVSAHLDSTTNHSSLSSDEDGLGQKRQRDPSGDGYRKRQRIGVNARTINSNLPIIDHNGSVLLQNRPEMFFGDLAEADRAPFAPQTVNGVARNSPWKQDSREILDTHGKVAHPSLGFPVVKDPQDPNTILSLSQGGSQKDLSQSPRKSVSFKSKTTFSQPQYSGSDESSKIASSSLSVANVLCDMDRQFPRARGTRLALDELPPTPEAVLNSMTAFGLPQVLYQDAYYSEERDVPERAREWAGREYKLESTTVPYLAHFDPTGTSAATFGQKPGIVPDKLKDAAIFKERRRHCTLRSWEIGEAPPTYDEIQNWVETEHHKARIVTGTTVEMAIQRASPKGKLSQVDGPTQRNKYGMKYTQKQKATSVQHEAQYMSTMSLEVHINTRGNFVPNPEEDEVQCVFWCLQSDEDGLESNGINPRTHVGIVVLSEDGKLAKEISRQTGYEVIEESSELDLIIRMVEIVRRHDPDILTGYEVHGGSWGFLIERARLKYEYNLCDEFSRMKAQSHGRFGKDNDKWGFNNTSTIRVTGRHMINIWRAMRGELNLLQYTMENVVFHVLHRRIPHYSWKDLTTWYISGQLNDLGKVLGYYTSRVQLDLDILEQNELIPRTSEQARLLGVDFFSVFSRGSQFKVESLMFRIAKPENFLLVSPSRKQVGGQNALECLPLVMEPQSAFYTSPLLVLDFQSLYPSVMIAYNYCYSTFLGRVVNWRGTNKMGFSEYKRQQRLLELLQDHINIAPNGIMYVKPEVRKSLLAKMLGEILETRVMVKSGMKIDKDDKTLQRLLNNRQLALKLIANVTYGYTSASFSGRMPCSEIADSIVQTGRETLEKAIALIHSVKRWGAEVVYGDTDSLFVYLKGRTKDQAFDIGEEIAKTVTNMNPRPVKLKFEKVYFPCVLLAKKRYVGFKYEHRSQTEPEFDAKGIETVRRDGTPAEQKIEEKALKILFRTADLSQVKSYFQTQCEKIMKGSVSIQDFCFAKEVKLGTYSENGLPPPGALISTKRMLEDARAEPQYGERVPYVVITGAPGARLIDRCVAPETLLHSEHSELDSEYYISKNLIPPLERIFNLTGANVRSWYDEMPKIQRIRRVDANLQLPGDGKSVALSKKTLESYMKSSSCLVCHVKLEAEGPICSNCMANKAVSLFAVRSRLSKVEKTARDLENVCRSCSGFGFTDQVACDSKDCPVFYSRTRVKAKLRMERGVVDPVMKLLEDIEGTDLEW